MWEKEPGHAGSEEYLNAEKYELKHWEIDRTDSLKDFISRINQIRREQPALYRNGVLDFQAVDNEQIIAYTRRTEDCSNILLVVVNLDPHYTQSGWVELPIEPLGLEPHQPFQAHDLLTDTRYMWQGPRNFVQLDPQACPAHIFLLRRRIHTERDFDYYT